MFFLCVCSLVDFVQLRTSQLYKFLGIAAKLPHLKSAVSANVKD